MPTANIFLHDTKGNPIPAAGNADGSLVISQGIYQIAVDEVDANTSYVGEADPGVAQSSAGWRIKKILKVGGVTTVKYADGAVTFTKVWNNRAGYTY